MGCYFIKIGVINMKIVRNLLVGAVIILGAQAHAAEQNNIEKVKKALSTCVSSVHSGYKLIRGKVWDRTEVSKNKGLDDTVHYGKRALVVIGLTALVGYGAYKLSKKVVGANSSS